MIIIIKTLKDHEECDCENRWRKEAVYNIVYYKTIVVFILQFKT